MRLSWAFACAIIILRGPWGSLVYMLCLWVVSSAVAVTCMQRHEHQSMICAKLVTNCKIRICDVRAGHEASSCGRMARRKAGWYCLKNCLLRGSRLTLT